MGRRLQEKILSVQKTPWHTTRCPPWSSSPPRVNTPQEYATAFECGVQQVALQRHLEYPDGPGIEARVICLLLSWSLGWEGTPVLTQQPGMQGI